MYYYSVNEYLQNEYGEKIYKLSLSISNTCPNRDGTVGTSGCIFCSNSGSGDFTKLYPTPIDKQIEFAKSLIKNKKHSDKYIAYFQSFTSTYQDIDILKNVLYKVIKRDDILILSVATRPDCLSEEIIKLLSDLNKIKPVWVELGLQTLNEKTVKLINRCYKNDVYFDAVDKLHKENINVITHVILGLPYETEKDIFSTIGKVSEVTDGIKIQLLHVLKNTVLEKMYKDNLFKALTLEEYTVLLSECIERLDKRVVIHRMTGDGNKKELIAPLWSADKKKTINYIRKYFIDNDITQGKKVGI